MAANQNVQDRLAQIGVTGHTVGNKTITFSGVTLSEAQIHEVERVANTQNMAVSLAAGVFTLTSR